MIEVLTESTVAAAIGWALVAFGWQGTIVAAVAAATLVALRKSDPRVRYAVACLALLVMVALPVATTVGSLWGSQTAASSLELSMEGADSSAWGREVEEAVESPGLLTAPAGGVGNTESPTPGRNAGWLPTVDIEQWLPAITLAWFAGVLLLTVRLAGGWVLIQRMRRLGRPVGGKIAAMAQHVSQRLGERRTVRVLESTLVSVPTAIGWLRPVVLLPTSALFGLSMEELEAVIAHEIAHVRRRDYLVNILQTTAETVLFYHPAVWWLSSRIRAEREHCADDLAIQACGDAVLYARALAGLESMKPAKGKTLSRTPMPGLGVGATGGSLLERVRRILGEPEMKRRASLSWLALPALAAVVAVTAFHGASVLGAEGAGQSQPGPEPTLEAVESMEMLEPVATATVEPELVAVEPSPEPVITRTAEAERVESEPVATTQSVIIEELAELAEAEPLRTARLFQNNPPAPPEPPAAPAPPAVAVPRVITAPGTQALTVFGTNSRRIGVRVEDGEQRGASVVDVTEDGPAAQAGIQEGDLIVEYNRTPVLGSQQLSRLVSETPLGRTVTLRYERNGREQDVEVTVAETPATTFFRGFDGEFNFEFDDAFEGLHVLNDNYSIFLGGGQTLGLRVQDLTPELRSFFGAEGTEGVLVASIEDDSIGGDAGILVGDVITAIDGNTVDSASDIRNLSNAVFRTGNSITVTVIRDGNDREIVVEPEE